MSKPSGARSTPPATEHNRRSSCFCKTMIVLQIVLITATIYAIWQSNVFLPTEDAYAESFGAGLAAHTPTRTPQQTLFPRPTARTNPATQTPEEYREKKLLLSPPLTQTVFPFKDLCESAVANVSSSGAVTDLPLPAEPAQVAPMRASMERFNHIPADGGASGAHWSSVTSLPQATQRTGEVRARVVAVTNRLDVYAQSAATAAAMAGVPLEILGVGWGHYSFLKRFDAMLSYADREGLTDADVLVGLDSDALFSGEDAYPLLEAFVASTAADEAEHLTYKVRDIRLGHRLPPVLYGAEFNCMRIQVTGYHRSCIHDDDDLELRMAAWAEENHVVLPSGYRRDNTFRHLNAGFFVGRVWAIRLLNAAFKDFMLTHRIEASPWPRWFCDQSVISTLHLELRRWELVAGALGEGTVLPRGDVLQRGCYVPPLVLPTEGRGPHNMPAGLIGVDRTASFVIVISDEMERLKLFRIGANTLTSNQYPEAAVRAYLAENGSTGTSRLGFTESRMRLEIVPRNHIDCAGVETAGADCAYRPAVLGTPAAATAPVRPLVWHFAGLRKRYVVVHYRAVFPWYVPTLSDVDARRTLITSLMHAPATRVFAVDPATDIDALFDPVALLPHNASNDVSFLSMCSRTDESPQKPH